MTAFEVGKGYWATNAINGNRMVVVALMRTDGAPTFARIREFGDVKQMVRIDGREVASVAFADGVYTASSAVAADVIEARRVLQAVAR